VKSFEMNKILKLLAIVTFLGLIPSIVGGMLGMNLAGNPWPVTLGQVAFCVGMAGATALYVFAMKGWLR
jgi:Mg2+ and Co2+ transporter CorA